MAIYPSRFAVPIRVNSAVVVFVQVAIAYAVGFMVDVIWRSFDDLYYFRPFVNVMYLQRGVRSQGFKRLIYCQILCHAV